MHASIALIGNPNCGKTALFNRLTGARQKVANYAGVTIERKEGKFRTEDGKSWRLLGLPGTYSLNAVTPDEQVTHQVVFGLRSDTAQPDLFICVVDACNLKRGLKLALEMKATQARLVLAVNMMDIARKRGVQIDLDRLSTELGIPVVETIAVQKDGVQQLLSSLQSLPLSSTAKPLQHQQFEPEQLQAEVAHLLDTCVRQDEQIKQSLSYKIDSWVLHPVLGPLIFITLMFFVFQAVFAWAQLPMEFIKSSMEGLGSMLESHMAEGMLRGLLVTGVIGGAGSVLVFLPQILILFFFILFLEDSGYLPRAAFLLDKVMGSVGLSGRAFIPLLSSFACAIPGVMATRTIQNPRDRIVTIMIAPLMTCSARLPVYALIIAAFIPERQIAGLFNLQGVVLFSLYMAGIIAALAVAYFFKKIWQVEKIAQALLLELPDYRWPNLRNLGLGLWERIKIFVSRVGTIILALMILLWFLSSFPGAPENASYPPIYYSIAGYLGRALEVVFAPIGFNWQICIALVPGMAAREVAVAALGTVYSLSASGEELNQALGPILSQSWSLPTAIALLAWYVLPPQCVATLSVVKRETNTWRYPILMAAYLFALAYLAAFLSYRIASLF